MKQTFSTLWGVLGIIVIVLFFINPCAKAQITSNILSGYSGHMLPAVTATIANGQTASGVINLKGFSLVGILLPPTMTGTTLTFTASVDGVTFVSVNTTTSGTALSYTITENTYAAINPIDFYGIHYLKIVSGTSEGAARTLTLALKGI